MAASAKQAPSPQPNCTRKVERSTHAGVPSTFLLTSWARSIMGAGIGWCLTVRSSRCHFTAAIFFGMFVLVCGRAVARLNSGVRPLRVIHSSFRSKQGTPHVHYRHPRVRIRLNWNFDWAGCSYPSPGVEERDCPSKRWCVNNCAVIAVGSRQNRWTRR